MGKGARPLRCHTNLNRIERNVFYCSETKVPPDDTEAEDSFSGVDLGTDREAGGV
jgi:hypothetical protein